VSERRAPPRLCSVSGPEPASAERAEGQSQAGHQAVHHASETLALRAGEVDDPRAKRPERGTRRQALQHSRYIKPADTVGARENDHAGRERHESREQDRLSPDEVRQATDRQQRE